MHIYESDVKLKKKQAVWGKHKRDIEEEKQRKIKRLEEYRMKRKEN